MVQASNICESCCKRAIEIKVESDEPAQPYQLCHSCHTHLVSLSLRPLEWYNLAVIHSPNKYYLHDDFYDEDGSACQPEEEFEDSFYEPAPNLDDVSHHLEELLDYSMTRWFIEEELIRAFQSFNKADILDSLKIRFSNTVNQEIKIRLIEIATEVLKIAAQDWIKELWDSYETEEGYLTVLSSAMASCLPQHEAFPLVLTQLAKVPEKKLPIYAFSCLYRFRSPLVLDWMEQQVQGFHDSWGRLAAASNPTWSKMVIWLETGRPLSLIALCAMTDCDGSPNDFVLRDIKPKILETPILEVDEVLKEYETKDNVPRVKRDVKYIMENKESIFI
ncbi:hypothetical protein [Sutcliffiella deserti]|uniref:hypothetical protein n=1 Tax=Sutcliffiella deserti TaxID=2875501 RepID=UPI001CBBADAD|nr:hypothetical protein [Sutcliffiella deserti]